MFLFINILFFSCVCLFVPGVYVIKIIIIILVNFDFHFLSTKETQQAEIFIVR